MHQSLRVRYDPKGETSYKWKYRWWHFIVDLSNVTGYAVPWENDDIRCDEPGDVTICPGHALENIPYENAINIIENLLVRWGFDLEKAEVGPGVAL